MKNFSKTICLILMVLIANGASAQFDIISAKDATKLVNDDNTIFVSTRKAEDYAKVHIKNAINFELKSLYQEGPVEGLLMNAADMAKILGENGVDPSKNIIIYDNGKYVYAGYLYYALDYLGYPNIKVLDGHMTGWRGSRGPVTKSPSTRPAIAVNQKVKSTLMVDYAYTKGKINSPGSLIVDVQSEKEFNEGHIPGAVNMENKLFFDEDSSTLKSKEEIEKVLSAHNIAKDKEIILYCASSARAGTVYLAMKALGYNNMKIYEGGWNEWKTK
jgi:thiosulfate/3-mercaptopyruvate sulfurtransferase